jgi:hypothetical protein
MTLTISPEHVAARHVTRPKASASRTGLADARPRTGLSAGAVPGPRRNKLDLLSRYLDSENRLRQVIALPGACGSVLVIDRDATTLGDRRLVAHLEADEPPENATLVCEHYLRDPAGRWCRRVTPEDLEVVPFTTRAAELEHRADAQESVPTLVDSQGHTYCLERVFAAMSIPELRWHRRSPDTGARRSEPVRIREVIASLESYEPVRTLTDRALAVHHDDPTVSVALLRGERARMEDSQIVLNRGLRRAVLAAAAAQDLSMSEIAVRCGRVKHDARGKESGETSWLARRLGIAPESGESAPTPWIHSDVLALIARCGLGISPREVELG